MFIAFQVLFAFFVGFWLIRRGVRVVRLPEATPPQRRKGWLMIVCGILALLWFPYVFSEESKHFHHDADGSWDDRARP